MIRSIVEWPAPHFAPSQKPFQRFPQDICAIALIWSGPVSTCMMPSIAPRPTRPTTPMLLTSLASSCPLRLAAANACCIDDHTPPSAGPSIPHMRG
jgi:hypothetical protein